VRPDHHRNATTALSLSLVVIGVAIVARTIDAGGGALSVGVLVGLLFAGAGVARLWLIWRKP
jgi:hypothetical protein